MPSDNNAPISATTVQQLAEMAGLAIDDARATILARELQAIRDDVRFMSVVDVGGFEPASASLKASSRAR